MQSLPLNIHSEPASTELKTGFEWTALMELRSFKRAMKLASHVKWMEEGCGVPYHRWWYQSLDPCHLWLVVLLPLASDWCQTHPRALCTPAAFDFQIPPDRCMVGSSTTSWLISRTCTWITGTHEILLGSLLLRPCKLPTVSRFPWQYGPEIYFQFYCTIDS